MELWYMAMAPSRVQVEGAKLDIFVAIRYFSLG